MKKISLFLSAVVFFCGAYSVSAQIENIKIDSTLIVNSAYAGLLAGSDFSQDSLSFSKSANFRVGVKATYSPTKWLSIVSTSVYQIDEQSKPMVINHFGAKFNFRKFCFETGFIPALASETRPMPASADAQFESFTEAGIPGGALGVKIKYNLSKDSYIGAGIAQRNDEPEYHLRYASSQAKISVYYSKFNNEFGTSVAVKTDRIYNSYVFNADQNLANLISYKISTKRDIDFYLDIKYDIKAEDIESFETGLLKNFSGKILKGFFGLSYCYDVKAIRGYLFIHI